MGLKKIKKKILKTKTITTDGTGKTEECECNYDYQLKNHQRFRIKTKLMELSGAKCALWKREFSSSYFGLPQANVRQKKGRDYLWAGI